MSVVEPEREYTQNISPTVREFDPALARWQLSIRFLWIHQPRSRPR